MAFGPCSVEKGLDLSLPQWPAQPGFFWGQRGTEAPGAWTESHPRHDTIASHCATNPGAPPFVSQLWGFCWACPAALSTWPAWPACLLACLFPPSALTRSTPNGRGHSDPTIKSRRMQTPAQWCRWPVRPEWDVDVDKPTGLRANPPTRTFCMTRPNR